MGIGIGITVALFAGFIALQRIRTNAWNKNIDWVKHSGFFKAIRQAEPNVFVADEFVLRFHHGHLSISPEAGLFPKLYYGPRAENNYLTRPSSYLIPEMAFPFQAPSAHWLAFFGPQSRPFFARDRTIEISPECVSLPYQLFEDGLVVAVKLARYLLRPDHKPMALANLHLNDPHAHVVLRALADFCWDEQVVAQVAPFLSQSETLNRETAFEILGLKALPYLSKLCQNPLWKEHAMKFLLRLEGDGVDTVLQQLAAQAGFHVKDTDTMVTFIHALKGCKKPEVCAYLCDLLRDSRASVQLAAVKTLAKVGDPTAIEPLCRLRDSLVLRSEMKTAINQVLAILQKEMATSARAGLTLSSDEAGGLSLVP